MLYKYKKIIDQYTTHYAEPPRDANGNADPTWFEHCTLDDGFTYVTCNVPVPAQETIIEFEPVADADPIHAAVVAASVHVDLVTKRVAAGKFMQADGHIVDGDEQTVAEWAGATVKAWSDPTNWHLDPVMKDDQRTFEGKLWKSLMDYNVWEPPIGWREVVDVGYPEWAQPTGAHDAYNLGDRVEFNGKNYESVIAANVWSPSVYPAGWVEVTG